VKVPVYQSKVVQYPSAATRAGSMPVPQISPGGPVDQGYMYTNSQANASEAYTTCSSRSSMSAMDAFGRQQSDLVQFTTLNGRCTSGVSDYDCGLQAAGSGEMGGSYPAGQYGQMLDSRARGVASRGIAGEQGMHSNVRC